MEEDGRMRGWSSSVVECFGSSWTTFEFDIAPVDAPFDAALASQGDIFELGKAGRASESWCRR